MEGVGLVRSSKFAKYLSAYGWQPVILTVNEARDSAIQEARLPQGPRGIKVFRTAYRDVIADTKNLLNFGGSKSRKTAGSGKRKVDLK